MRSSAVLAVLLPLLVLGAAGVGLRRDGAISGRALGMERRLREAQPEVVVLGSSLARADVDVRTLSEALGVAPGRIEVLTLPNATAAHWYAILKNRVLTQPERPRLVLVVGALTTMITPDILRDSNIERLMNQLTDDEPVIAAKVLRTDSAAVFRWWFLRERAGATRDAVVDGWRDLALWVLFGARGRVDGAALAEMVNTRVFSDAQMDYGLHREGATGLPVRARDELDLSDVDVATDSLLPDLAALARDAGVRLVFVRTPFPPSNQDNDPVPAELVEEAARVMVEGGAAWLDLASMGMRETEFDDMRHMSPAGAVRFTRELAARLVRDGLAGVVPPPEWRPARVAGLSADGRLFADGRLEVAWDTPWPGDPLRFQVAVRVTGEAAGAARLRVGDEVHALTAHGATGWVVVHPPAPRGPFALTLEAGGPVRVDALVVGGVVVAGDGAALAPRAVRLLGGRVEDVEVEPVFERAPPSPAAGGQARRAGPGMGAFALPGLAALADQGGVDGGNADACSPLRVREDGEVLALPHEPCLDVGRLRGGRTCHAGNSLYFSASDGTQPGENGRSYELALAEDRRCSRLGQGGTTPLRDLLWVYPGDRYALPVPPERASALDVGANRLELTWSSPLVAEGDALTVRLEVDGEEVVAVSLPAVQGEGARVVPLPRPVRDGEVRVVVEGSGARSFWLLRSALLSEVYEPLPAAVEVPIATAGDRPADRVLRVGDPPSVAPPKATRALPHDLEEQQLYPLWPVSDTQLVQRGHGAISPLRGDVAGRVLRPTAQKRQIKAACDDCFLHEGKVVTLPRPPGPVRWYLEPGVPEEVEGVWWVYPGTTLRFEHDAPWAGEALRVELRADLLTSGQKASAPPLLRVAGRVAELTADADRWVAAVGLDEAGHGPWAIEVISPADGPFLLVERLVRQDGDVARDVARGRRPSDD